MTPTIPTTTPFAEPDLDEWEALPDETEPAPGHSPDPNKQDPFPDRGDDGELPETAPPDPDDEPVGPAEPHPGG